MNSVKVALVGNPNCGKTALFNALTGSNQRVGNWSGVTVDKKMGHFDEQDHGCDVLDLPGIYSLVSYSESTGLDEKITCDYLLTQPVDIIVNVLDATNLERHLFLTTQLLELGIPVVVAVNMLDIAERRQINLDLPALAAALECPVVGVVAHRGQHVDQLKQAIVSVAKSPCATKQRLLLPPVLRKGHDQLVEFLRCSGKELKYKEFVATAMLEGGQRVNERLTPDVYATALDVVQVIQSRLEEDSDLIIADRRYRWCQKLRSTAVLESKVGDAKPRTTWSSLIDRLVLNRWLGFPIFLLMMYALFFFAINVGGAFQDFFDQSSDALCVQGFAHLLTSWHAPSWVVALLAYGLGKGINTTITFIPMIAALFFFLSFLEDSGYMARATFLMDRLMRFLGLPGEAFVPMIVGFGCNVPAVMGARTLSKRRDRVLTVMMMPFMACSARFAIFTIFAAAFFVHSGALVIFALYLLGIVAAIGTGLILRKTCLKGSSAPLVMELPHYHCPQFTVLCRLMWRRARSFVLRAGKVIIPVSIILGGLNAITVQGDWQHADHRVSVLSEIGQVVTPVFAPMGIKQDNWPATVGLATGVLAKEVVIGTLNSLYQEQAIQAGQFDLGASLIAALKTIPTNLVQLKNAFANPIAASAADVSMDQSVLSTMEHRFGSTAAAFSFLLFVLLYFPCISTLAVMRREVGRAWANCSIIWSFVLAYAAGVLSYQFLTLAAHPATSLFWIGGVLVFMTISLFAWRGYAKKEMYLNGGKHVTST
jgi:ferrous iron transport protein B